MTAPSGSRRPAVNVRSAVQAIRLVLETLIAARWTASSLRSLRRDLRLHGLRAKVESPPQLRRSAVRGVQWTLRQGRATCLERALIAQRWLSAHGVDRAVVVGAASTDGSFHAHAWLEGDDSGGHTELTRLEPTR